MGRSYYVDEAVEKYFTKIIPEVKSYVTGLLVGHLIFAVDKTSRKNRLWSLTESEVTDRAAVHVCAASRKNTCRTFDVSDPKSTAKPADWKCQNAPSSWLTIDCNVHVDLTIPLSSSATYQEKQRCTRQGLAQWAKELENAIVFFNGQVKDPDGDLIEEQKKSRSVAHSSPQSMSANIVVTSNSTNRSTALVQACKSSLSIQGVVKCRGHVSSNKPKVKDALQAIKRDLLNTLSDRCEIMFEDVILNGSQHESERALCPLPQRVFVPLPASTIMLCDYVFGDESEDDLQNRFLEMLDLEVYYKTFVFVEEMNNRDTHENEHQPHHDLCKPDQPASDDKHILREGESKRLQPNLGLLMATAVVLLATLISLHFLNE
ncbi:protein odr-4 homolog isoform X2 [Ranitomeya variabilis]|uniref:protein odr-4 homolog isoform X2 n=1 Tax=Ranitomeya variabilis TaxID=490064 RepID=UPI004055B700